MSVTDDLRIKFEGEEERILKDLGKGRDAMRSLSFLADQCIERGFLRKKQESNAELIGRALREATLPTYIKLTAP